MSKKLGVRLYTLDDLLFVKRLDHYCGNKYKERVDVFGTAVLDWLNNRNTQYTHTEVSILTEQKLWKKLKGEEAKLSFLESFADMLGRFKAFVDDGKPVDAEYEYVHWFAERLKENRCYYCRTEF